MATNALDGKITAIDYVVFALSIIATSAIGCFYAYKDRNNAGMDNFHLGNRKINPVAVTFSIAVTLISALVIVGTTAEIYSFGTMISWNIVGEALGTAIAAHIFLPIFYKMDRISIFELFERRFGKAPRTICAFLAVLNMCLANGITLYAPALAFEAMTGISVFIAMALTTGVCISYTVLGGMKAVVWADALQFAIIVAGIVCLLVEGCASVGGLDEAWSIANRFGRIQFDNFDFDPRTRHTVWNVAIGFTSTYSFLIATNQLTIQRACSLSTLRSAKLAIWFSLSGVVLVTIINLLNGVVMFAYYHTCDPVASKRIGRADQLFPLMIVDTLGRLPGLPGLLLACLFSAALSTISSTYTGMSAIIIEDFFRPYSRHKLSDKTLLVLSKVVVIVMGSIVFGMGCLFSTLKGLISQLVLSIGSLIGGPLFAFFLVGVLFPWINTPGIIAGFVVSLSLSGWLIVGTLLNMPPPTSLPVSVEGCTTGSPGINITTITTTTNATVLPSTSITTNVPVVMAEETGGVEEFYKLSYMWYHLFGTLVFVIVSLSVSFLTGPRDPKTVDSKLMSPLFYNLCPFLPDKYRRKLLFGVNYDEDCTKKHVPIEATVNVVPEVKEKTDPWTTRL